MNALKVGKKYKEFATGHDEIKLDFQNGALDLYITMCGLSDSEKKMLKSPATIKVYEDNGILFLCCNFAGWIFDAPFDPGLQKFAKGNFEFNEGAVAIYTQIFDSGTGECIRLNLKTLTDKQSKKIKQICQEAKPLRPEDSNYLIGKTYMFKTSEDMYRKGF